MLFLVTQIFHNGRPTSVYSISRSVQWCFPTPVPSHWTNPVSYFMSQWIWWTEYGRAVFGTVCLSWQVTHLPSKVWFLWPQIPQARRNSQITQKVSRGSLWGVLWFLTHPTSWDHLLSKLPFLLLWTLESFESLMPTSYVFTYLQRYLQLHVLNSVKLGRLFEPGMRMRWEGKCQFTI